MRSDQPFENGKLIHETVQPFLSYLIDEIERAFEIPANLKGFTVLDPCSIPITVAELNEFGDEGINNIADFYGNTSNQRPSIVDPVSVITQYKAYKIFVLKKKIDW